MVVSRIQTELLYHLLRRLLPQVVRATEERINGLKNFLVKNDETEDAQ